MCSICVPYNLDFTLYVMAKNSDDALQIVEQILPYFQPDNITINDMSDMGIKRDVPIILGSVSYEDSYQETLKKKSNYIHPYLHCEVLSIRLLLLIGY